MAGVIASVSLHNEKDTRAVVKQFSVSKSNYILPEFDQTFQPVKHNIFFIRRANYLGQRKTDRPRSEVKEEERTKSTLASRRVCLEVFLMGWFIITVT